MEYISKFVFYELSKAHKIRERVLHDILSAHGQEDVAELYSKGWFGGRSMSGRRRSQKVKAQRRRSTRRSRSMCGGKKPRRPRSAKRRKAAMPPRIVYAQAPAPAAAPPPQVVYAQAPGPGEPMEPMPKQGAFTWGDAAKLLVVDVAGQAIGHEVTEALED